LGTLGRALLKREKHKRELLTRREIRGKKKKREWFKGKNLRPHVEKKKKDLWQAQKGRASGGGRGVCPPFRGKKKTVPREMKKKERIKSAERTYNSKRRKKTTQPPRKNDTVKIISGKGERRPAFREKKGKKKTNVGSSKSRKRKKGLFQKEKISPTGKRGTPTKEKEKGRDDGRRGRFFFGREKGWRRRERKKEPASPGERKKKGKMCPDEGKRSTNWS